MQYIFLSDKFYEVYAGCSEIEQKPERPYVALLMDVDGVQFAIPFRSHIRHKFAFMTDKANGCGLDYTKAVVLTSAEYIGAGTPRIRENEHRELIGKEYEVRAGLLRYIKVYKKAKAAPHVPAKQNIIRFSTLQYFEEFL